MSGSLRGVVTLVGLLAVMLLHSAAAFAAQGWSSPVPADPALTDPVVSCPSVSFCVAVSSNSTAATFKAGVWTEPSPIPITEGSISSVSCASSSFCVAVGGTQAIAFNGSSWSEPTTIDSVGSLASVSCPSSSFCVAVGGADEVKFNGSSWSSPVTIDAINRSLTGVSCPSSSFCAAVDVRGFVMTFNGSSWTAPAATGINHLAAVSCPSASFCMAAGTTPVPVGDHGIGPSGSEVTYDGSSWSPPMSTSPVPSFTGLSCRSSTFCVAIGNGVPIIFNGSSWSIPSNVDPGVGQRGAQIAIASLSCPSSSFCVAADDTGRVLNFNGSSWSRPFAVGGGSDFVSCASPSFCMAVDQNGRAVDFYRGSWRRPMSIDGLTPLMSVSCQSSRFCGAGDLYGDVLTFNGSSWGAPTQIRNTVWPARISCSSSYFCLATTSDTVARFNGSSWSAARRTPLRHDVFVSCPSRSFCASVNGNWAVTFHRGVRSKLATLILKSGELTSLSCAMASFCVAVGHGAKGTGAAVTYNGRSWSKPRRLDRGASLDSVSCPSSSFCVAVDSHGRATTFNGSRWSKPVSIDGANDLTSVSCPSSSLCVAMDVDGNALTDKVPQVRIESPRATFNGDQTRIVLTCGSRSPVTACRGTLSLVLPTSRVVLARSGYVLPRGRQRAVNLQLGDRALLLVGYSRVQAIATLVGGPDATRSIALRP